MGTIWTIGLLFCRNDDENYEDYVHLNVHGTTHDSRVQGQKVWADLFTVCEMNLFLEKV